MKLVGIAEIAGIAGVSAAAVANWRLRHSDFPKPVSELKAGPVFKLSEVRKWLGGRRAAACVANRDPHYERITDRLATLRNGDLFERCVTDLLRDEHPTLIPVPGGDDAGMDGTWTEGDQHGFLIATVGQNVIGNVTRNLESNSRAGDGRRRVLVATSQLLSRRQCDNIRKRVEELGYVLAHDPYTGLAIADRLYHNSRWCMELLGVTTPASALSRVPRVIRPFRSLPLVGREESLAWILETSGDRMVVGQPGVGKTCLAQQLVHEGRALFVTGESPDGVVEAIRDQQPSAIVVEDAHLRLALLRAIQRFREETGARYDIVVDAWPGRADDVQSLLCIESTHVHVLNPLPPDLIVEIINTAGIAGPHELMYELVRQSRGYPGRAALLAHACLSGGVREVWKGETLARWVGQTVERLVGDQDMQMLAGFAIGGRSGMAIDVVCELLEVGAGLMRQRLSQLAASGAVHEVDSDTVAVFPESLRCVLVRDHFFREVAPLPYKRFVQHAPRLGESIRAIARAKGLGAAVPLADLLHLLEQTNDPGAWSTFAWTDRQHAHVVLTQYPDKVIDLAEPLLHRLPERALPALLDRLPSPLNGDETVLRTIKDWIRSAEPGEDEAVARRRTLANALKAWFADGRPPDVGLSLLSAMLDPGFEDHQQDPGDRLKLTIRRAILRPHELRDVAALWQQILPVLRGLTRPNLRPVLAAIDQWVFPQRLGGHLSTEHTDLCMETAGLMLADLATMAEGQPGLCSEIRERAAFLSISVSVHIDETFAILYPQDRLSGDWREREARQIRAAHTLAHQWSHLQPEMVAQQLASATREAMIAGISYPDYTSRICRWLAVNVDHAIPWIDALLAVDVQSENVRPFLEKAAAAREPGWKEKAISCFRHPTHAPVGASVLLQETELDESLLTAIVRDARRCPMMIRCMCHRGELAAAHVPRFLQHDVAEVVEAVAVGIWESEPMGVIAADLQDVWTRAVIQHVAAEYDLLRILEHDPDLAFEWLMNRAQADLPSYRVEDNIIKCAASILTKEQRVSVLRAVVDVFNARHIVRYVVGNDASLYRLLLADPGKEDVHLAPLHGRPDEEWASLALVALEAGYTPQEVASSAHRRGGAFVGSVSSRYARRADQWACLQSHAHEEIREVARVGRDASLADAAAWKRREDREELAEMYLE